MAFASSLIFDSTPTKRSFLRFGDCERARARVLGTLTVVALFVAYEDHVADQINNEARRHEVGARAKKEMNENTRYIECASERASEQASEQASARARYQSDGGRHASAPSFPRSFARACARHRSRRL